jgi:hypothetical protein
MHTERDLHTYTILHLYNVHTGNLVESDVPRYIAAAESGFSFQPLPQQDRPLRSAVRPDITLQGCGQLYRRMDQNPASDNSAAQVCMHAHTAI